ncbi:hypothetical protein IMZ48_40315 [Candidatus Bathyarchaeota archaeon]|nr:hypothetical protein [Candidatus Bathyarchaeota archaeon]
MGSRRREPQRPKIIDPDPHRSSRALSPSCWGGKAGADGLFEHEVSIEGKARPPAVFGFWPGADAEAAMEGRGLIGREGRPIWQGRSTAPAQPAFDHFVTRFSHHLCAKP